MADASPGRYLSIHYLRAIAAIMVLIYHVFSYHVLDIGNVALVSWLRHGVAIFFVISGFVIVSSTSTGSQAPLQFLRRRLFRIVPLYWLATLGLMLSLGESDWYHLVTSLLFLPTVDAANHQILSPLVDVGWTLNFEMAFYTLFALSMLLPRYVAIWLVILLLVILTFLPEVMSPPLVAVYYLNPLLLNFAAGMMIAHLRLRAPAWGLPVGFALLAALSTWWGWPPLCVTLPAVLIVASARSLDGKFREHPLAMLLGDASYAIYLSHLAVIFTLRPAVQPTDPVTFTLILMASILASLALGIAVHLLVEKPIQTLLRRCNRPAQTQSNSSEGLLS